MARRVDGRRSPSEPSAEHEATLPLFHLEEPEEVKGLRRTFHWLLGGLTLFAVLSAVGLLLIAFELGDQALRKPMDLTSWGAILALVAGAFGSSVASLLSAADRCAAGWELSDGRPWPPGAKGEKANANMRPLFLIRPVLGASVSLIVYAGIVGNTLPGDFKSPATIVFVGLVAGFFAKTILDVLKDVAKALVGRRRTDSA